jgi:hypothetical protein
MVQSGEKANSARRGRAQDTPVRASQVVRMDDVRATEYRTEPDPGADGRETRSMTEPSVAST